MANAEITLLVDLGDQMRVVEERVKDGSYASAAEVIRAARRDYECGGIEDDDWLAELAEKALADPRPSLPAEQVFRRLREKLGRTEPRNSPRELGCYGRAIPGI